MNNIKQIPGMDLQQETLRTVSVLSLCNNPNPGLLNMEIWKDIPGYEGYYQASSMGRVKSLDKTITQKGKSGTEFTRFYKGRILKPLKNKEGYTMVELSVHNIIKSYKIQRLIAITFIPNPENKPTTNHINGNKKDNSVVNLEWMTNKENTRHAFRNGLMTNSTGENSNFAKLNELQVRVIRKCPDLNRKELAKVFNISADNIWRILRNYTWKNLLDPAKYNEYPIGK